ncbi:FCPF [Symbiodinium sp. KB8]|nr:FCPF [Symbiodinium sp. KB8]
MGLKFADVPNGLAAISKVPAGGWTQILLYMGWCEVSRGAGSDIASGRPGDFGWYVLTSADPEEKKKKLNAELANGRLAMMAIIGMFYQDGLTGSAWGDWANFTESPLRAASQDSPGHGGHGKRLGATLHMATALATTMSRYS